MSKALVKEKAIERERLDRLASAFAMHTSRRFGDSGERLQAFGRGRAALKAALDEQVCREPKSHEQLEHEWEREEGLEEFSTVDIVLLFAPVGRALSFGFKFLRPLGLAAKIAGAKIVQGAGALGKTVVPPLRAACIRVLEPMRLALRTRQNGAFQSLKPEYLIQRWNVARGKPVFRVGEFKNQRIGDAQFWGLGRPPVGEGQAALIQYAKDNGTQAVERMDWIVKATPKTTVPRVTRPSVELGTYPGGLPEVVVPSGGMRIDWFHMPP